MASTTASSQRPFWFWLSALGVVALGVRLLHLGYVVRALGAAQILDAAYYHDLALALLGRPSAPGLQSEIAFANLGYPHVLSWLYAIEPSPTSALLFQAVLGAATTISTGLVARDLFERERVGLWAAGLYALYAPSIFYDGLLLIPSLSAFLTALLAWSSCRAIRLGSWQPYALAGVAIGLAALLRASQILLLPLILVVLSRARRRSARPPWRLLSALLLACLACVAPIIIRQRLTSGHLIPLTANGGVNFWIGNHRGASGSYTTAPFLGSSKGGDFQHTLVVERDRFLAEAERRSGNAVLSLAGADAFWWRETVRSIVAAPRQWLRVLLQKCRLVFNDYESRTNTSFDFGAQISPLLRYNPLRFGVISVLAALGVSECLRPNARPKDRCAGWLLSALVAVPVLTCIVFFVSGEYRHAAAPALAALAAFGLSRFAATAEAGAGSAAKQFLAWPRALALLGSSVLAFAPTERLGPATDRKAYAEALAMPSSDGSPPTFESYALARSLLSEHGSAPEDRLLSSEALLLVESNQAIQFQDRAAAERLIRTSQSLWQEELRPNAPLDAATIERIRRNTVRRLAQLCRQPFIGEWQSIKLELALRGCHSWDEVGSLIRRQQLSEAEAMLARAFALAPHSVEVLAYRGQLELLHGRDPTKLLERSSDGYPKLARPAALLAQYALARADHESARRHAREASKREPSNLAARDLLALSEPQPGPADPPGSPLLVTNRVSALLHEGRGQLALSQLQSAVQRGVYDEGLRYALGNLMLSETTPQALIEFFSSTLARDEKPQTSHYFLALGFERMGRDEACLTELRRALELDPAHEMSQRQWGLLLERQGDWASALQHFVEATRIHPEYRAALEDAARVSERLGRTSDAEQWRQQARTVDPDTPRRFLYWSRYLHAHGRDSAALIEVRRRLSADPLDAQAVELERVIVAALGTRKSQANHQSRTP